MRCSIPQRKPRVEITPLIDVIFLLLVFFIYSMLIMSVHRGMPMSLPKSSTAVEEYENAINISIKSDGSIYFDKKKVNLEQLKLELIQYKEENKDKNIVVQVFGEDTLEYQKLYNVLDIIKNTGMSKISLQAIKK